MFAEIFSFWRRDDRRNQIVAPRDSAERIDLDLSKSVVVIHEDETDGFLPVRFGGDRFPASVAHNLVRSQFVESGHYPRRTEWASVARRLEEFRLTHQMFISLSDGKPILEIKVNDDFDR